MAIGYNRVWHSGQWATGVAAQADGNKRESAGYLSVLLSAYRGMLVSSLML